MEKIAIDLTWLRPGKVGGTESMVRNLIDGIDRLETNEVCWVLLVTQENAESFAKYGHKEHMSLMLCDTTSSSQLKRTLWQNVKLCSAIRKQGINKILEPIYSMPLIVPSRMKFYTIIHDLQAIHYPQYFSRFRVWFMRFMWGNSVRHAKKIIAISYYVKEDIIKYYPKAEGKTFVLYNAIDVDTEDVLDRDYPRNYYGVEEKQYYYTVSSLLPHKNLETIIKAVGELYKEGSDKAYPLIISGVGGKNKDTLNALIRDLGLEGKVQMTPYISNKERNTLYKFARAYLFPSVFEGFGMPPIESLLFGTPTITTRETSIPEVTQGLAVYVNKAKDPKEWAELLKEELEKVNLEQIQKAFCEYEKQYVAEKLIEILR